MIELIKIDTDNNSFKVIASYEQKPFAIYTEAEATLGEVYKDFGKYLKRQKSKLGEKK